MEIDPTWFERKFMRYMLNSRMTNFQSDEDRWMNVHVEIDPMVQKLLYYGGIRPRVFKE
jgi:hypothetical protein